LKRAGILLLSLAAAGALLLAVGRPPSRYVLETEAARLHELRREQYYLITRALARAAEDHAPTDPFRAELDRAMFASMRVTLGGWDVVFLPKGAPPAGPGYAVWGEVDPAARLDPLPLKGAWSVRMRPVSWTARLAAAVGLGP